MQADGCKQRMKTKEYRYRYGADGPMADGPTSRWADGHGPMANGPMDFGFEAIVQVADADGF